jgi:hypothetical protein
LAVNAIETMRDHLPSLLMRASALVHHVGHFYHSLARMVEVGLMRFQESPRIFDRRAAKEPRAESFSDETARFLVDKGKRSISAEGDSSSEVSAPKDSLPGSGTKGKFKNKKLIVSIHIPKTGGTTFLEILKAIAQEVLYLDYGNQIFSPTANSVIRWDARSV